MPMSTLTEKGQTTIPKTVREHLQLKPRDKLLYLLENDRVILRVIHGDLRGLKGILKDAVHGPINFKTLREETQRLVAKKVLRELA